MANSKYGKGKGKQSYKNRGKNRESDAFEKSSPNLSHDNDVSWYAAHSQLLVDSASHAYGLPVGAKYSYHEGISLSDDVSVPEYLYVPGIMRLGFVPSCGIAEDANSPINVIARNIYSFVVHANSRNTRYNAPDIMMYLLAVDSLHMLHAWLTRTYGIMNFNTTQNRYLTKHLIRTMGFNYESLSSNMADFRGLINTLGVKLGALAVPDTIPYFKRHRWMVSNVWMDSPNTKAQLYFYHPDGFFQYEEMFTNPDEESGHPRHEWGNLRLYTTDGGYTITDIRKLIDKLYNPVIESEDCNIIAGDILKAFGGDKLLLVPQIPTDFSISPSYNEEVLTQIHNYRGMGQVADTYGFIDQDVERNVIVHNPKFPASVVGADMNVLFDLPYDSPTPADTMVASRMTVLAKPIADGVFYSEFQLSSCGSEIPTMATMYTLDWDETEKKSDLLSFAIYGDMKMRVVNGTGAGSSTIVLDQKQKLTALCLLTNFNLHPLVRFWSESVTTDNSTTYEYLSTHGDITNFTIMNAADLRKMHEVALMSEYAVPAMGQSFQLR